VTLDRAFGELRRIRDEFAAGQWALKYLQSIWDTDSDVAINAIRDKVTATEIQRCRKNLEITFVIRLFSEFEAILREYWRNGLSRPTEPPMFDLMESIARRQDMNASDLAAAHGIREYRNDIIHESLRDGRFDFRTCLGDLSKYIRWLPGQW
jgi:HAMP domain-containing protein